MQEGQIVAVSISQTFLRIWCPSPVVAPWYSPHHAQYLSKKTPLEKG
jgi:hypothetical protein